MAVEKVATLAMALLTMALLTMALLTTKVALFRLRAECGAVLKLDSGDMLVVADLTPLLRMEPGRDVWAVQALGQPTGNLNGGRTLFR